MKHDVRAPFLLMSHHRSGSNFVNDLLQAHPQIECINEPLSMHTGFFRDCDLVPWTEADYDAQHLHGALGPHEALRAYLVELRQYLRSSCSARVVGFKETGLFGKLGWLKAYLPELKIVFLRRDPRAIVTSVLRSGLIDFWRYSELVPAAFARLWPHWSGGDADEVVRLAQLAAMSVATRYELARRELAAFDHCVVDLGALAHEPQQSLDALTRFLGLAPCPEQAAFLAKRQDASRGGTFSSFRAPAEVEQAWRSQLSARQLHAVEAVLEVTRCPAQQDAPIGEPAR